MEQQNQEQQQTTVQSQRNQIYISNYEDSVTAKTIEQYFEKFGKIVEKKIIQGKCSFITYEKQEDAQKAIDQANGMSFQTDKKIRVEFSSNPKQSPSEANLFVQSLNPKTNYQGLKDYFIQFGQVISTKISYNSFEQSNCYGYVQFEKAEDAQKVLQIKEHKIDGQNVIVKQFKEKNQREQSENHTVCLNLKKQTKFINENEANQREDAIKKIFGEYGKVESVTISQHNLAYIKYDNEESVKKAIECLNGKDIFNFNTTAQVYNPNQANQKNSENQLIASQICNQVTEKDILDAFKEFNITDVQLTFKQIKNNQQAILSFENKSDATNALCKANKIPQVKALFEKKTPLLNIFLDSSSLKDFKQTVGQKKQLQVPKENFIPVNLNLNQQQVFNKPLIIGQQHQFYPQKQRYYNRHGNNQYHHNNHHNNNYHNRNQPHHQPKAYNRNKHHGNQYQNDEKENYIHQLENKIRIEPQPGQDVNYFKNEVWRELGSKVYPKVQARIGGGDVNKDKFSKITGMIVDLETHDIRNIVTALYDEKLLNSQIDEALEVYQQSLQK
ncbi:Polyadenylate-binding protein/Hyperplastic disc protein [Pseudocohnilembus persalinus]|uniref:Polyadenylate-binding protein/Hyperplastic disc protein n=1 Tax=Pseudocohnilembus persalinus TaxID=266149 RepID=A0A0V0QMD1_PSEPJ|nr:Polyadenylate-binding protein/Hyperplastic disc protein [Pseudocohnilembus persalinus]|eukprot:KRX03322.1 Polyadenylate-binding protein/Hyperplastic disc protein [Pseudocohnilembus persalinus]